MTEIRRYLAHFRGHTGALVVAGALMALSAALPGATVLLLRRALDDIAAGKGEHLGLEAAGFAGFYVLQAIIDLGRTAMTKRIALGVCSRVRQELFACQLALPPGEGSVGARLSALTQDVDELQYGVSALVTAFRNPLQLAVLGATAASMAPGLVPFALVLLPAVAVPAWIGGKRLRVIGAAVRDGRAALVSAAQEDLTGARVVQSFAAEKAEQERFNAIERRDFAARMRLEVERVIPGSAVEVLAAGAVAILVWEGGRRVIGGSLGPGGLVGFAVALGLMNKPLSGLGEVWALLQRSMAATERVHATIDAAPRVTPPTHPAMMPSRPCGIAWEGVSFARGDRTILDRIDLAVAPGEIVALVGPTGAGKSTLLALASRLLDPSAGCVRLGGVDVRDLPISELRRAIGTVDQEQFLFGRTIAENLRLARPDADDDAIQAAIAAAGADAFVRALPGGIHAPLAELGRSLSGGERQRLCLARALLADGPVLLLDEATNQLDTTTRDLILGSLDALRAGRAVIVVAHDPDVARAADRIVTLTGGRLGPGA